MKKEIKKQKKARQLLWDYLLNNIDAPHWELLKKNYNRLTDNIEKLEKMKVDSNELEYMRLNRKKAMKALKIIKKARKVKKYHLVQLDRRTWKEIEVKP